MPRRLSNMDSQAIAAYLPADLAHRARTHAKATRRSLSSVVAEALDIFFERADRYAAIEKVARVDAEQAVQQAAKTLDGE